MHRVFVFGTLKEGFPNFATNTGRRLAGEFVTSQAYPFYLVGERHSPWLVDQPGAGLRVRGQVFEVDEAVLAGMDLLERIHEPDGYRRATISVEPVGVDDHLPIEVFVYLKQAAHFVQSEARLGPLREYTLEHAALYRPRTRLGELLLDGASSPAGRLPIWLTSKSCASGLATSPKPELKSDRVPPQSLSDSTRAIAKSAGPPAAATAASSPASPWRWCGSPGR